MAADHSDDADDPPAKPADHPADQAKTPDVPAREQPDHPADRPDSPADHRNESRREQIEPRSREEACTTLRAITGPDDRTEPSGRSEPGAHSNPAKPTENEPQAPSDASQGKTADKPPVEPSDRSPDRPQAPADDAKRPGRPEAELPSRAEDSTDLRADTELAERTEPVGRSEPGARSKPAEIGPQPPAGDTWEDKADLARWIWAKYKSIWSDEERPPVDGSRALSHDINIQLDEEYDRIAERERDLISPSLREVESRDPHRHLVGFERRLKELDRIKEKIYDDIDLLGRSPHEAISLVPDAIRFTFQYDESRYTQGVWADITYMKEQGFELDKLKNLWSDDQYRGVNSQWIEPNTGQRFELQFHTRISFEAKELTHKAYERLRTHQADALEELVLEAFQRKVTGSVPVPPGATGIPDYSKGEWHDR